MDVPGLSIHRNLLRYLGGRLFNEHTGPLQDMPEVPVLEHGPQHPSVRLDDDHVLCPAVFQKCFQVIGIPEPDDPRMGLLKACRALSRFPARIVFGVEQLAAIAVHGQSLAGHPEFDLGGTLQPRDQAGYLRLPLSQDGQVLLQ